LVTCPFSVSRDPAFTADLGVAGDGGPIDPAEFPFPLIPSYRCTMLEIDVRRPLGLWFVLWGGTSEEEPEEWPEDNVVYASADLEGYMIIDWGREREAVEGMVPPDVGERRGLLLGALRVREAWPSGVSIGVFGLGFDFAEDNGDATGRALCSCKGVSGSSEVGRGV
jgi:hypothetical protein